MTRLRPDDHPCVVTTFEIQRFLRFRWQKHSKFHAGIDSNFNPWFQKVDLLDVTVDQVAGAEHHGPARCQKNLVGLYTYMNWRTWCDPCQRGLDFNRRFCQTTDHSALLFPNADYHSLKQVFKAGELGHRLTIGSSYNVHGISLRRNTSLIERDGVLSQSKNLLMIMCDIEHWDLVGFIPGTQIVDNARL